MEFAKFLASKSEELKGACEARPPLPSEVPSALATFRSMEYGQDPQLWEFARLQDVFRYLRGAKKLRIPLEWRDEVPRSFPAASAEAA